MYDSSEPLSLFLALQETQCLLLRHLLLQVILPLQHRRFPAQFNVNLLKDNLLVDAFIERKLIQGSSCDLL
jgi:hypothetical protein